MGQLWTISGMKSLGGSLGSLRSRNCVIWSNLSRQGRSAYGFAKMPLKCDGTMNGHEVSHP